MNLMINNYCNLRCKYCFALGEQEKPVSMSPEDFAYCVAFIKNRGGQNKSIRIIGGEPTLHPYFIEYCKHVLEDPYWNKLHIFTNALELTESKVTQLLDPRMSYLVNFNSRRDIGDKKFEKTIKNVLYAAEAYTEKFGAHRIALGINLYEVGQDYSYILDLATKIKIRRIRFSITTPKTFNTESITLDYYKMFADYICKFVADCERLGIQAGVDCNTPPKCIYSYENLMKLVMSNSGLIGKQQCHPVIDVKPNLDLARCFVFDGYLTPNLKDFSNIKEIFDCFESNIDAHKYNIPTFKECHGCTYMKERKCQGGCLGYKNYNNVRVSQIAR